MPPPPLPLLEPVMDVDEVVAVGLVAIEDIVLLVAALGKLLTTAVRASMSALYWAAHAVEYPTRTMPAPGNMGPISLPCRH